MWPSFDRALRFQDRQSESGRKPLPPVRNHFGRNIVKSASNVGNAVKDTAAKEDEGFSIFNLFYLQCVSGGWKCRFSKSPFLTVDWKNGGMNL
jgi:hypothetical protein